MENLRKLKDLIDQVIESSDKEEIYAIIKSLKSYKTDMIFHQIIDINLSLKDEFDLKNFKFHSLLTLQQAMIEVSGLSLDEIQRRLSSNYSLNKRI